MSSKLVTGAAVDAARPMPWMTVGPRPGTLTPSAQPYMTARQVESEAQASAAEASTEARVREAREAGRREGEAAARQATQAEVREVIGRLAAAIQQVTELRPRLRLQAESDLVRLAVAIARRIVFRELSIDPETVTALVRVALDKLRMQEVTRVRVHPEHKAVIQEFLAKTGGAAHVEVNGDPTQARGSVVFETIRGNLDVSAEIQLREIERGLSDRLKGQGA